VILGLDTSTSELTVAVARAGEVAGERSVAADETGRPRHARELMPAIEAVVDAADGWSAISRIAVGVGPGTFTGLRIGVATGRALAQAQGLPIVGVSSLAALAAGVRSGLSPVLPRLALIDAKRNEVFAALFGPDGTRLWPDAVFSGEALVGRLAELGSPPLAVGAGVLRFRDQITAAGGLVMAVEDPANRLQAREVCKLGEGANPSTVAELEPNYLRRPDAELWRERLSQS